MPFDIPFIRPVFPDSSLIGRDFDGIVASNWFTNFGPREREFSRAIGGYIGDGFTAVTFTNATIGLIAVVSSALGRGDNTRYVLIPSFTFAAGAEAIEWAGYRPILIDIDPQSLQPSLEDARAAVDGFGQGIAGILLCNTFGIGNPEIAAWEQFAEESGLVLLIDSAAGFGSRYEDGHPVGTAGLAEVFSFHATKPFAIGEGGAVVTRDVGLAETLMSFQNFGFREGRGAAALGLNGKLQEISAAIGLRQLATLDAALESRQAALAYYREVLAGYPIEFPTLIEASSVCFASMLLPNNVLRQRALERLREGGVEARAYYSPALHEQPHFSDSARASDLEVTREVVDTVLSVPLHQQMSRVDTDRVTDIIRAAVDGP